MSNPSQPSAATSLRISSAPGFSAMVGRVQSVDILRGIVMILMAIDHVRVYSGIPAGGPTPGIFFTRWITHFCAPAFVFFAGTSALLYYLKINVKGKLAKFLVTRGLLLVFLELTLIKLFWCFNLNYAEFTLAGVIWMLGWCMVLLSLFVRLKPTTIGMIGLIIIFAQQVFHYVPNAFPMSARKAVGYFWGFFYPSSQDNMPGIAILYVLLPWLGVMMIGYAFGAILRMDPARVKKICMGVGLTSIAAFLIIGSILVFRTPDEQNRPFIMRLLNQQKYPPSQLYLLMTLGPVIALVPWAQRAKGWLIEICKTIGRVPMFYYLLHILLIHVSALVVNLVLTGSAHQEWYNTAPFTQMPDDQHWSLGLLYLVYAIDLVILYFACRWYEKFKFSHPEIGWLKYI
jgi:uncharacterized membrane protein